MSNVKSPRQTKKKKPVKNSYDLVQFKKMVGKGLITLWSGVVINKKLLAEETKKIKEKILNGSVKTIGLNGYLNNGIIYIFNGCEKLLSISSVSYSEIKKSQIDVEISINQYPKLTKEEVMALLG